MLSQFCDATDFDGGEYVSEPKMDSGDEVTPMAQNKGKGRPSGNRCLLDPRDPGNFLKLVSALNIFLADSLTDAEINKADTLIHEHNIELIEVSQALAGFALYQANHNLALQPCSYQAKPPLFNTYSRIYICDFGPVAGFWTYIFEQLNKTLKSQKHNNHGRGVLEMTWFNTFLGAQWVC